MELMITYLASGSQRHTASDLINPIHCNNILQDYKYQELLQKELNLNS